MVTSADIMARPEVRGVVDGHAMAWFPEECCGLLVTGRAGHTAVLAHNGVEDATPEVPGGAEDTCKSAYLLDPMEVVRAEERGETLVAIFHSHCRVGAYFSEVDKRRALAPTGVPWFPEVDYVVLDAQDDGVKGFKVYRWSKDKGDFVER